MKGGGGGQDPLPSLSPDMTRDKKESLSPLSGCRVAFGVRRADLGWECKREKTFPGIGFLKSRKKPSLLEGWRRFSGGNRIYSCGVKGRGE